MVLAANVQLPCVENVTLTVSRRLFTPFTCVLGLIRSGQDKGFIYNSRCSVLKIIMYLKFFN